MVLLVITSPLYIVVLALEFVYRAKLCGRPSLFSKFIVTLAPAGTVIVLLSKARLLATRLIVTLVGVVVGVGLDVVVGVGLEVTVGVVVGVDVGVIVGVWVGVGLVVAVIVGVAVGVGVGVAFGPHALIAATAVRRNTRDSR